MVAPSWAFHRLSSFTLQITWADSVHRKDDPGQIIFVSLVFTGSEIPCAMGCQSSTGQTDTTGGHRKAQSLSCFVHNSSWYSLCLFWLRQNIFLMFPLNDNDSWWGFFFLFFPLFLYMCSYGCFPSMDIGVINQQVWGKDAREPLRTTCPSTPQFCYNQIQD